MKISDIYESTTSGSVATVAQPMTGGALSRVGQGVYGKQKGGNLLTGKKTKKPYANSIAENKQIEEAHLEEDDLILVPGKGHLHRTGLTPHDYDKGEHEGETLKNSLHTISRVAMKLDKHLSSHDQFPEWVSEKVGAAKSMMTGVMQYLISQDEMELDGDLDESHGMSDTRTSAPKTGDEVTPEHDEAYATLKRMAPRLYRFIRYDAPMPIDPIQTLQYLQRSGGSEGQLLNMIKSHIAADTKRQYGDDHPSLAESMRRFLNRLITESTGGVIAGGIAAEGKDIDYRSLSMGKMHKGKHYDDPVYDADGQEVSPYDYDDEADEDDLERIKHLSGFGKGMEEGAKVDRFVKHVEKSEEKSGKSKKEAENIAWATANTRSMLDNKNKKK